MKNSKSTMKWLLLFAIAGVFAVTSSCRKKEAKEEPTPTTQTFDSESSEDQALADNSGDDLGSMADEAVDGNLTSYKAENGLLGGTGCATVTVDPIDPLTFPKTVTIDFGNACLGPDGRTRKGQVIITLDRPMRDSGAVMTISTLDYFVSVKDSPTRFHQVIGKKTITNKGRFPHYYNGSYILVRKITSSVDSGRIIRANGGVITWSNNRTKLIRFDGNTSNFRGDLIFNYGYGYGTTAKGISYTIMVEQSSPLVRNWMECRYFISGIIKLSIENSSSKEIFKIDFAGENPVACNQALIIWAGQDDLFGTADDKSKTVYLFK